MSKSLRDIRQAEFAQMWLESDRKKILLLAPRFGKIRTTINILKKLKDPKILIAYPDSEIKKSWEADFKELKYDTSKVFYTTHLSLKKCVYEKYDIVVIDEIHLLSKAQIEVCKDLFVINKQILGLTGTMSSYTEYTLKDELNLGVVARYSISQAVKEGVIVDYEINVITVPLDTIKLNDYKGKKKSEKKHFDGYTWVISLLERQNKPTMFLRLARMKIIQASLAKTNATKALLTKYKNERVLVFCGITSIADSLGIPSYHSKSSEKELFKDFANGKGKHMAVVKIGNTGVTYKSLDKVIINYFDSNGENLAQKINRCMAFEYNNPDKKAKIYIISSNEPVELKWLESALSFFDTDKIKYI